jgi:DNA-binding HxlR family transcriptional regulator
VASRELPREVRELIQSAVPGMDALEILIHLCRHPGERFTARELAEALSPSVIAESAIVETLRSLETHGLVQREHDRSTFRPASAELERACAGLLLAYNERPVTLIRTLYDIADSKKIQAFADAFRIRKEP